MKAFGLAISCLMLALAPAAHAETPSATARISAVPQNLWLNVGRGVKFAPPEGKAQIIATNRYLAPDAFFFATLSDMACLADGSLVVSGEAWNRGDYTPIGWWRIATDGAITPFPALTMTADTKAPLPYRFGVAPDGSAVSATREMIYRVRGNASQRLAGQNEVSGFKDGMREAALFKSPRAPILDDAGNIWVSDQDGCALRRVTPGGAVVTVVGPDRSSCSELPAGERVVLDSIAWDPLAGEIVAGGSVIVSRPAHDMHVMVWRVRPDGQARRIYYTVKAGRSPIGQNMDHIWAVAVDPKGRIVVSTRTMGGRARRQIMRLDEAAQRLIPLTGQTLGRDDMRPGHEEAPYDGPVARANFRESKRMCFTPDGTLFVLDEHLVRRINVDGTVRTWGY